MHYWDIISLSVWWAEDLNLTGKGCGRSESAYAPTFDDLINFWCSTNLFLIGRISTIIGDQNIWGRVEPYGKVRAYMGNLARNLILPLISIITDKHWMIHWKELLYLHLQLSSHLLMSGRTWFWWMKQDQCLKSGCRFLGSVVTSDFRLIH